MKYSISLVIGITIGAILTYVLYTNQSQAKSGWQITYKHDDNGNPIEGNKEDLKTAIRNGYAVRVGWGWYNQERELSIEHMATPIWLTVINETEVMAQLDPQVLSRIDWENTTANYADSSLLEAEWRVVLTTEGTFDAVWYNRKTHEVIRRMPQNHIMSWFVEYPANAELSQTKLHELIPIGG